MGTGRPTVYSEKLLERARGYLTSYKDMGDLIPSIAGLACVLGITRETCHAWARDPEKEAFSDILKELAQRQERELLNGGLGGHMNSTISKLVLTKHGYSDRVEQDHRSSDGSMTPQKIIIAPADDNGND
jgi:predicted CopG family antitoxin